MYGHPRPTVAMDPKPRFQLPDILKKWRASTDYAYPLIYSFPLIDCFPPSIWGADKSGLEDNLYKCVAFAAFANVAYMISELYDDA